MTILDFLQDKNYQKKAILEKLICYKTGLTKEKLFIEAEQTLEEEQKNRIQRAYSQYTIEKKPLEYILGYVEFFKLKFTVTPDTLIPRPETEYMIEAVNDEIGGKDTHLSKKKNCKYSILDIGTGCGVLGLTTLYYNKKYISEILLTDISEKALHIAKENYTHHFGKNPKLNTKIDFIKANLLDHPDVTKILKGTTPHETIVIANLPYIPEQAFEDNTDETVKKREPKMAFVGGDDGLDYYREMFDQIVTLKLKTESTKRESLAEKVTMFLEMMTRQVDILRKEYPQMSFEEVKTFHFNIRIVRSKFL